MYETVPMELYTCGKHFEQPIGDLPSGYLLAMKDLCLLRHIPDLIHAGVCSFKIEGRMRHADFLKEVVSIYRKEIDTYLDNPATYYLNSMEYEQLYNHRVREFTTSMAFTPASASLVDISGSREPLILSRAAKERSLTKEDLYNNPFEETLIPLLNTREHENTVTVHPHLNLPHQGGRIQGDNEYSPPLVGGVRGGELLQNTFLPTEGANLCDSPTAIRRPLLAVKSKFDECIKRSAG